MKDTRKIPPTTDPIIRDIPSAEQKKIETTIAHLDGLFSNNANGVFLYDDDMWGELFIRAISTPGYCNLISQEEKVYSTFRDALQLYFSDIQNIILYGPGDGRKDSIILQQIDPSLRILEGKVIHPVDVNVSFAHNAGENIKAVCVKKWINTLTSACIGDFVHAKELQQQKISDKLYAFFGGSIGNFSDEDIVTLLKNITSDKIHGSRFALITAFFEPDFHDYTEHTAREDALLKSYDTQAVKERVLYGLQKLGVLSESIVFDVQYERNSDRWWRVLIGAKVVKDIHVSYAWKTYCASAGDSLRAIQSRRFKKDYFTQLAGQAEHSVVQYYEEGGVGCVVTKTKEENPENETVESKKLRLQKVQKASFFSISAIAALWLMTNLSEQYQDHRARIHRKEQSAAEINKKSSMKWAWHPLSSYYTSEWLESSWKYAYVDIFMRSYDLNDDACEAIKPIFQARLSDMNLKGIYVSTRWGTSAECYTIIENFISEFHTIILADKWINLRRHPKLWQYADILRNTYFMETQKENLQWVLKDDNITWKNGYGKAMSIWNNASHGEPMTYWSREWYRIWEYIIESIDGHKYILARKKADADGEPWSFSTEVAKELARDYFTPPQIEQITTCFTNLCLKYGANDSLYTYEYIHNKIIDLCAKWYSIQIPTMLKYDWFDNIKMQYLATYFPEIVESFTIKIDQTHNNLTPIIDLQMREITQYAKNIQNTAIVTLRDNIFTILVGKPCYQWEQKEWLSSNATSICPDDVIFPFSKEFICNDNANHVISAIHECRKWTAWLMNKDSCIIINKESRLYSFIVGGSYTTKEWHTFERWFIEKDRVSHEQILVAKYIWNNNQFLQSAENVLHTNFLTAQSNFQTETSIPSWSMVSGNYASPIRIQETEAVLHNIIRDYNTYFAYTIYQDWLSRGK